MGLSPTIPTVAAGRILTATQADITATRTFPSLTGLTKAPGDLLIAICCTYLAGTNPQFGSWGGGFTEFHDSGTGTTMGIGCAYKWSDGTETGTFTVTQAGVTITGHAAMILLAIPGAHLTTIPEHGTQVADTAAAADPGSLSPSWGAEENLFIIVGACGETSTTGSFTGMASHPAYTGFANTGISSDVLGGIDAAVAFKLAQAASDDPAAFSVDVSAARNSAVLLAVRPKEFEGWGVLL